MNKKYQIFVSSTYNDLRNERQDVLKSILDLGHIPSGMELFFAADEEKFKYISKIIDEFDYYILVIGGRYGSMDEAGMSFTEKEYDYTISKSIPVLAFIRNDIMSIPVGRVDVDEMKTQKLKYFTAKVSKGRLVCFWNDRQGLQSQVIISLAKAFDQAPRIGWLRANVAATEDILSQANKLHERVENLEAENEQLRAQLTPKVSNLAPLSDSHEIKFKYTPRNSDYEKDSGVLALTWEQIIQSVGPGFFRPVIDSHIEVALDTALSETFKDRRYFQIYKSTLDVIKIQLMALGLLKSLKAAATSRGVIEFLELTDFGRQTLIEIMAIRTKPAADGGS